MAAIETPIGGTMSVKAVMQDGEGPDTLSPKTTVGKEHHHEMYALYAAFENTVEFSFYSPDGKLRTTDYLLEWPRNRIRHLPNFKMVYNYLSCPCKDIIRPVKSP